MLAVLAVSTMCASAGAEAAERELIDLLNSAGGIVSSVDAGYSSSKAWRGARVGDSEGTAAVVAENLATLPGDVKLDLALLQSLADGASTAAQDETRGSVAVTKELEKWLLGVSYHWYSVGFDKVDRGDSQEVGFSVARTVGPVQLSYTQYVDVQGDNGGYSELAALYSNDFNTGITLDFAATLGYLTEEGDFSHAEVKVSTDIPITERVYAQPFAAYVVELDNPAGLFADDSNFFYGGVQFKTKF